MPQRVVVVLTWFLATVIATAIGFTATTTVGDVIRDAGPVGAEFRDSPPDTDRNAVPRRETFGVEGVLLTAECIGRTARLVDLRAPAPWTVLDSDPGPDEDIDVELDRGDGVVRDIEVYCGADGEPRPVVGRYATPR